MRPRAMDRPAPSPIREERDPDGPTPAALGPPAGGGPARRRHRPHDPAGAGRPEVPPRRPTVPDPALGRRRPRLGPAPALPRLRGAGPARRRLGDRPRPRLVADRGP